MGEIHLHSGEEAEYQSDNCSKNEEACEDAKLNSVKALSSDSPQGVEPPAGTTYM